MANETAPVTIAGAVSFFLCSILSESTAGVPTVARDIGHVLPFSVTAVIAAIFRIAANGASTHFVSAFSFICHFSFLLLLIICLAR